MTRSLDRLYRSPKGTRASSLFSELRRPPRAPCATLALPQERRVAVCRAVPTVTPSVLVFFPLNLTTSSTGVACRPDSNHNPRWPRSVAMDVRWFSAPQPWLTRSFDLIYHDPKGTRASSLISGLRRPIRAPCATLALPQKRRVSVCRAVPTPELFRPSSFSH